MASRHRAESVVSFSVELPAQVGVNRMTVGDQTYRFFRSFTHIADVGAVIFAPA